MMYETDIESIGGDWQCFVNGMQNQTKKTILQTWEVLHFANLHGYEFVNTPCEYIIRVYLSGIQYEFRNNHYARENRNN